MVCVIVPPDFRIAARLPECLSSDTDATPFQSRSPVSNPGVDHQVDSRLAVTLRMVGLPDAAVINNETLALAEVACLQLRGVNFPVEGLRVDPNFLFASHNPCFAHLLFGHAIDKQSIDVNFHAIVAPF